MTILEQEKIKPDAMCIKYTIYFHRIEIFDWLLEQFNNITDYLATSCFMQEFVHGIQRIDRINPQHFFVISCAGGLAYIAKLLVNNHELNLENGLCGACRNGNIEIVKLILSLHQLISMQNWFNYFF